MHQPLPFQRVKKFSFLKREEQKEATIQYFLGALIKSINRFDEVIARTKWMKKAVLSSCRLQETKVHQIYHQWKKQKTSVNMTIQINSFILEAVKAIKM